MPLSTFRYQIVFDVTDKSGTLVMSGVEVLPNGATPPDFRIGDPWRVELATGDFLQGTVSVANRKILFNDPDNWIVQYDFSISED